MDQETQSRVKAEQFDLHLVKDVALRVNEEMHSEIGGEDYIN